MKILVLGHKGMLGRAVTKFLNENTNHQVATINSRWGDNDFSEEIKKIEADIIINGIGKIPQKKPEAIDYTKINVDLPRFLETLDIRVIHPSTDCEFKGNIPAGEAYTKTDKRDADDDYGISKAVISAEIENGFKNTKIIRTSIIGHEENSNLALLDWFLSQTGSVKGYTNHYWNGITTLEWIKQAQNLIDNWDNFPVLNQLSTTEHYSKFDIINLAKEVYKKDIEITPFTTEITVNKCLVSDIELPDLRTQLIELKEFFNK
jgi:dTDP-4-dehydrorhamnose reductase